MDFRTQITVQEKEPKIDYQSKVFLLGSCFVENMGEKLEFYKFQNLQNPFGILYHPAALETFLKRVANDYRYTSKDIFFSNERWQSFEAHSDLADPDPEVALHMLNDYLSRAGNFLKKSTHIIITLGTAWGYRHLQSAKTVGNCHKVPQKYFSKELFSIEKVESCLTGVLEALKKLKPGLQIIFTVSPVRHFRDGIIGNQRSKAHLITALHNLLGKEGACENRPHYFPSYEIMMDDLRDYRFYDRDMLHPGPLAIDYIWEKFTAAWISPDALSTMSEVEAVQKGLSHRPFNPDSLAHKKFVEDLEKKIEKLKIQYSHLQF